MAKKGGYFAGGMKPTGLSSSNDGFSGIQSHKATFGENECTLEVGREETLDITAQGGGGKKGKKSKGGMQSYA